jgi:hypothetical protein
MSMDIGILCGKAVMLIVAMKERPLPILLADHEFKMAVLVL